MADRNKYLVLHGWSKHAEFDRFTDAALFRAFMQEFHPKCRFDIWIETETAQKNSFMLSQGTEPVYETRCRFEGLAALMIGRDHAKILERRNMRTWQRNI